jgi:DNA-binding transcriptional MocR family regulator
VPKAQCHSVPLLICFCLIYLQLQAHYRRQRDTIVEAIETYMPGMCTFTRPTGGMFLWLTFPTLGHITTHQLFEAFAKADVIVAPGPGFYVPSIHEVIAGDPTLRRDTVEISGQDGSGSVRVVDSVTESSTAVGAASAAHTVPCVRACYAAVGPEKLVQAVQAMAQCVKALAAEAPTSAP